MSTYVSALLALWFLFLSGCSSQSSDDTVKDFSSIDDNTVIGRGFSTDKKMLTQSHCFNAKVIKRSELSSEIKLTDGATYAELKKALKAQANIKGTYNMIDVEAEVDYMSSLHENDYTLTVNYYVIIHRDVTLHIDGDKTNALTTLGQKIYNNQKNFGIACGDQFVSGYREGATLILGLHITFSTKREKENIQAKLKGKFSNIVEASGKMAKEFDSTHNNDFMTISARQHGGDAAEINNIIGPHGTTCSVENIEKCKSIALKLQSYAYEFINQVKIGQKRILLHTTHQSIDDLGLDASATRITGLDKSIDGYRDELKRLLREYEEIIRKLNRLLAEYPVKRDASLEEQARSVLKNALDNVDILNDEHTGINQCYKQPKNCEAHRNNLKSRLIHIDLSKDIKNFDKMKNIIVWEYGEFYHTGGNSVGSWLYNSKNRAVQITVHYQSNEELRFQVTIGSKYWYYNYTWNSNVQSYTTNKCETLKCELKIETSPFYFDQSDVLKEINAIDE